MNFYIERYRPTKVHIGTKVCFWGLGHHQRGIIIKMNKVTAQVLGGFPHDQQYHEDISCVWKLPINDLHEGWDITVLYLTK
jgi:hypothetical protein